MTGHWNLELTLPFACQVEVAKEAFHSEDTMEDGEDDEEEREASPKAVGHNIFILAHQVGQSLLLDISHCS